MRAHIFNSAECYICGETFRGQFPHPVIFCGKHRSDEVDFYQSLQDGPLTKDQEAQRRLFEKRWSVGRRLFEKRWSVGS